MPIMRIKPMTPNILHLASLIYHCCAIMHGSTHQLEEAPYRDLEERDERDEVRKNTRWVVVVPLSLTGRGQEAELQRANCAPGDHER